LGGRLAAREWGRAGGRRLAIIYILSRLDQFSPAPEKETPTRFFCMAHYRRLPRGREGRVTGEFDGTGWDLGIAEQFIAERAHQLASFRVVAHGALLDGA
jgi:hypothetical protein